MQRIKSVNPESAAGKTKELLDTVKKNMGMVPNLLKALANSPAVLEAYLGISGALAGGVLAPKIRESIALVVAEINRCDYCLAAHTMIGKKAGLTDAEVLESRRGVLQDPKANAAVQLTKAVLDKQGFVADADIQAAKKAGLSEAEIVEVVANVILNIFTNYFNHVIETEIDFPKAPALG
jgi:uncharacterized peroxidase-related enzyme